LCHIGKWEVVSHLEWEYEKTKVVDTIIDQSPKKKTKKGVAFHSSHNKYLKKLVIIL
jgi:hypothetical protein